MRPPSRPVVLLVQLGTPEAPTPSALRRYLREFLGDPKVIDLPRWLWLPILYGPILTFRPRKSAALYRRVWTEQGSPLLLHSQELRERVAAVLGSEIDLRLAMRYGMPGLDEALRELAREEVGELLLVPLFPQFSETTTGSVLEAARKTLAALADPPRLRVLPPYYEHPAYIGALAATAREQVAANGEPELWLFTFHGIPQSYARKGDPYPRQCERTAVALAGALELSDERWLMSYQSRVGPFPWLQPYTDRTLATLGERGVHKLYAMCPGFAADCLETLDEIGAVGADQLAAAGGGSLELIPCLNAHPAWVGALASMIREALAAPPDTA